MKEEARKFSLHDYMGSSATTQQHLSRATEQVNMMQHTANPSVFQHRQPALQLPSSQPATCSRLTFSINPQQLQPQAQQQVVAATNSTMPSLTFNLPKISRASTAVAGAIPGGETHIRVDAMTHQRPEAAEDVMRLSAQLEESREKLNRMQSKLQATEQSVARANQALVSERTAASARMNQLVAELRVSREAETKLKQELANSPKRIELERTTEAFKLQAEGALRLEEEHSKLKRVKDDLDAKMQQTQEALHELTVQHESLVAEHESTCKALGVAQGAAEQAKTDECCDGTTEDAASAGRPSLEEQKLEIDAAVSQARAETSRTIEDLNNQLLAAKADTEAANQTASSMTTERDKMSASKNYCEELLAQSAKSLQEAVNERDQAQVLLKTTQDAMTAELPDAAMASLKDYTDAAIEAHRLGAAQPAMHTASSKSELVHAEQRASRLFEALATGVQTPMFTVTSDRDTSEIHSIRELKRSFAGNRFKHFVDSQAMVPMTAAADILDVHPDEIHKETFDTAATAEQTAGGRMVIVVMDKKESSLDFSDPQIRVKAAVTAISVDMKRVFQALRKDYHQKISTGEDTGYYGTNGYASSSTDEDPDELADENLVAVHPVDEEASSADA